MSFTIDPANPIPIYRQLVDQVIYRIASKELAPGDQLPSIRSLSTELRINPNTVIKAYRELELLGFAASHHGKGYFVAAGGVDPARAEWRKQVLEDLRAAVSRAITMGIRLEKLREVVEEALILEGEKPAGDTLYSEESYDSRSDSDKLNGETKTKETHHE